ncbi:hypothetical protein [Leptolyngbya sp. FACHB-261]|uniref:hypothetical protein n=1 Tax=Leptolyngbya sp. FACHB-261 TaxID=2692806 RepID=UPI0016849909|nr:hypothetical protein [Leptolyngbya sp. FACHB-261]MBD2104329.1 hypothetical protein [Leptolyngbya sp. FACHB-261]
MFQTLRNAMVTVAVALPMVMLNAQSASADRRDFAVLNNTDLTIEQLYVSSSNSGRWGQDRLGSEVLESGGSFPVNFTNGSNQCVYDVKAIYEDGSYDLAMAQNLCELTYIEFAGAQGDYQ